MKKFKDIFNKSIRLSGERQAHIEKDHPEMLGQFSKVKETLLTPEIIVRSIVDLEVALYYRRYSTTPVTDKYLCVILKTADDDTFIITAYFTDTIKKGEILWKKK